MMKITWWKVLYDWVDITNRPIYNYIWVSRKGSFRLQPTYAERRENGNRIDTIDDWDRLLYEVWHDFELDSIHWDRKQAEKYLEELILADDYYNWNEKQDEFYFDEYPTDISKEDIDTIYHYM